MPRPRISSETEDLLKELDEILGKLYKGQENPKVLKESKGRGSGDYTYTQDSVIKYALESKVAFLENVVEVHHLND